MNTKIKKPSLFGRRVVGSQKNVPHVSKQVNIPSESVPYGIVAPLNSQKPELYLKQVSYGGENFMIY